MLNNTLCVKKKNQLKSGPNFHTVKYGQVSVASALLVSRAVDLHSRFKKHKSAHTDTQDKQVLLFANHYVNVRRGSVVAE